MVGAIGGGSGHGAGVESAGQRRSGRGGLYRAAVGVWESVRHRRARGSGGGHRPVPGVRGGSVLLGAGVSAGGGGVARAGVGVLVCAGAVSRGGVGGDRRGARGGRAWGCVMGGVVAFAGSRSVVSPLVTPAVRAVLAAGRSVVVGDAAGVDAAVAAVAGAAARVVRCGAGGSWVPAASSGLWAAALRWSPSLLFRLPPEPPSTGGGESPLRVRPLSGRPRATLVTHLPATTR